MNANLPSTKPYLIRAIHQWCCDNGLTPSFQARFAGVARDIWVPMGSVSAIYARENGAGMAFEPENIAAPAATVDLDSEAPPEPPPAGGRARLQRVK